MQGVHKAAGLFFFFFSSRKMKVTVCAPNDLGYSTTGRYCIISKRRSHWLKNQPILFLKSHSFCNDNSDATLQPWRWSKNLLLWPLFLPHPRAIPQHQTLVGGSTVTFAMSHWQRRQNFRHGCIVFKISFIPVSTAFIVSSGRTFIQILSWLPPRFGLDGSGHRQEVNVRVCVLTICCSKCVCLCMYSILTGF